MLFLEKVFGIEDFEVVHLPAAKRRTFKWNIGTVLCVVLPINFWTFWWKPRHLMTERCKVVVALNFVPFFATPESSLQWIQIKKILLLCFSIFVVLSVFLPAYKAARRIFFKLELTRARPEAMEHNSLSPKPSCSFPIPPIWPSLVCFSSRPISALQLQRSKSGEKKHCHRRFAHASMTREQTDRQTEREREREREWVSTAVVNSERTLGRKYLWE